MSVAIQIDDIDAWKQLDDRIDEVLNLLQSDNALYLMIFDMVNNLKQCEYHDIELQRRIPEVLTVLQSDDALSNMILDMINRV